MIYDGSRHGLDLKIVLVGVWDHWGGALVAWWLGSRGCCSSEGSFYGEFSVCRLRSQCFFPVRD